MKITKARLRQIIKEELDYMDIEDISDEDRLGSTQVRYFDEPDAVHGDNPVFAGNQEEARMIRDKLMAAIEAGNLDDLDGENLEFAKQFLKHFETVKKQFTRR